MSAAPPVLSDVKTNPLFVSVGLPVPLALAFAGPHPVRKLGLEDLTDTRLRAEGADVIGCPLMSGAVDALSVIAALEAAGFAGTLLVVAPTLPDPFMVERELCAAAPGLTLRLVSL